MRRVFWLSASGCCQPPPPLPLSAPTYRLAQHTHTHTHPHLGVSKTTLGVPHGCVLGLPAMSPPAGFAAASAAASATARLWSLQINWLFRHWAASICLTTHFLNSRTPFAASLSLLSLSPSFTCHKVVWQSSWNSPANGFVATSQVLGAKRLPRALTPTPRNPPSPS